MDNINRRIQDSLSRGFIDKDINIDEEIKTRFLTNNIKEKLSVLDTIKSELETCKSFTFSVAFVTKDGLPELKSIFVDLKEKGIKGRLITSNYLYFNHPDVFRDLLKITNLEVRITESVGYHAKGYLFEHEEYDTLIIGSSNLTSSALKVNHEWNLKISSLSEGEIVNEVKETIQDIWISAIPLTEEWILKYAATYKAPPVMIQEDQVTATKEIVPNFMQTQALSGIQEMRDNGEDKSLLISATGTGKTYLSAFDVKKYQPKRFLFIVHREQILHDAINSFHRVIGNDINEYGILSGTRKDLDKKYLFATIQSISMDRYLNNFDPKDFDYIVVDEVHRSGAGSYLKVLNYFEPNFLLGMSATPERTDNFNIYELFDYNIAYEIRLQDALEEELVCPFHYFGVTDYTINDKAIDETSELKYLVSDERIDYLVEKIEYYGHSGSQVKGLIFTSRTAEAEEVSTKLNQIGYRTKYLLGTHSNEEREEAIRNLENGILEYIVTVDVFNEGIDIPSVNQVVMMRETQSSIIFIQQLGRGLRLHPEKDFVTVIDYIGNYKNNYLIPIALSGDMSMDKDSIRRKTIDTSYISGVSSINFERVAKERIFESISESKMTNVSNYKKIYFSLKNKLGRVPMLEDFYLHNSIDPKLLATYKDSYYSFIFYYDKEGFEETFASGLEEDQIKVLKMFSNEILEGKRQHETVLIQYLLRNDEISYHELEDQFVSRGLYYSDRTIDSVLAMFTMDFYYKPTRSTYQDFSIVEIQEEVVRFTKEMIGCLENSTFKIFLNDILRTSELLSTQYQKGTQFTLGELYSVKDVTRLLEWGSDITSGIFGYFIKNKEIPVFVILNKENVEESIDYKDGFINKRTLMWDSKSNRTLSSKEVQTIIHAKESGYKILLFLKTDKKTYGKYHYYLGEMYPDMESVRQEKMNDGKPVVRMQMNLETEVEEKLYKYLIRKVDN